MWAYRLDKATNHYGMTASLEVMREKVRTAHHVYVLRCINSSEFDPNPPGDTPFQFEQDVDTAKAMARSLGWDTTLKAMSCFLVPGPDSFLYGFIITQATGGQRYLMSPVPLDYLKEHIDWNHHTSTEEVSAARAALEGGKIGPPPLQQTEWSRSRKNNMYCFINGAQVTIFGAKRGGFKGIIASADGRKKTFTRAFQTELDCATYIPKNFYNLIREWGINSADTRNEPSNNPFAGVVWGDDDPF